MKLLKKKIDMESKYEIITLGKNDAHYADNERIKGAIVRFCEDQSKEILSYNSPAWYRGWFKFIKLGKNNYYGSVDRPICFMEVRLKKVKE